MIQQTVIPISNHVDISIDIPNELIGKKLKVSIDIENKILPNNEPFKQKEFEQWIKDAENSPTMSIEVLEGKWKKKELELDKLIQ